MGLRKGSSSSSKGSAPHLGYLEGFADSYTFVKELGKGGNGVVRLAVHRQSGACQQPRQPLCRCSIPSLACDLFPRTEFLGTRQHGCTQLG